MKIVSESNTASELAAAEKLQGIDKDEGLGSEMAQKPDG